MMRRLAVAVIALGMCIASPGTAVAQAGDPFAPVEGPTNNIAGGSAIAINAAPYQVMVAHLPPGAQGTLCGGSLIRPDVVLTAGHCVDGKNIADFVVFAGNRDPLNQPGGHTRVVVNAKLHPAYDTASPPGGGAWDVALLFLGSPVPLSNSVRTIGIATPAEVAAATNGFTTGWGVTGPNQGLSTVGLKQVPVSIYSDTACTNLFVSGGAGQLHRPDREVCAGPAINTVPSYGTPIGACSGDSGGALVINTPNGQRIAGVTSWAYTCGVVPAVYAEAPRFRQWYFDALPKKSCVGQVATVDIGLGMSPTPGNDVISGTPNSDLVPASPGDDLVCGGPGNDVLNGGAGHDSLFAGPGSDTVSGGLGIDKIWGGDGLDLIFGGDGDDFLYGMNQLDTIDGGAGDDTVFGGPGNDVLTGSAGSDRLFGIDGDDMLDGGAGDDWLFGGAGNDVVAGSFGLDRLWGGSGGDQLSGGPGNDFLYGFGGPDVLSGGDGDDVLFGGDGADQLNGDLGNDRLDGRAGVDVCVGGGQIGDQLFDCP